MPEGLEVAAALAGETELPSETEIKRTRRLGSAGLEFLVGLTVELGAANLRCGACRLVVRTGTVRSISGMLGLNVGGATLDLRAG